MGLLDLKIYLGKNKKSSKRVTLKQLIEQAIKEGHDKNNVKQETKSDSFADVSASCSNLRYKNLRTKSRVGSESKKTFEKKQGSLYEK